jgi:hypothetical protein
MLAPQPLTVGEQGPRLLEGAVVAHSRLQRRAKVLLGLAGGGGQRAAAGDDGGGAGAEQPSADTFQVGDQLVGDAVIPCPDRRLDVVGRAPDPRAAVRPVPPAVLQSAERGLVAAMPQVEQSQRPGRVGAGCRTVCTHDGRAAGAVTLGRTAPLRTVPDPITDPEEIIA